MIKSITFSNINFNFIKGTLKAFGDNLKNKQRSNEVMFLICKRMCILKVYPIHYTLK